MPNDTPPASASESEDTAIPSSDDLTTWADHLDALIHGRTGSRFNRVRVLAETDSTQDAARRLAADEPGLVVVAGRQTAGRGRLGRVWQDQAGKGLAITVTLDAKEFEPERVSLAVGVAAARVAELAADVQPPNVARDTIRSKVDGWAFASLAMWLFDTATRFNPDRRPRVGLRWPNDVVMHQEPNRKIAGALVERVDDLLLVGIGMNVMQNEVDFGGELAGRAVSLHQLGSDWTRLDVAGRCLLELDDALGLSPDDLAARWRYRNTLVGRLCTFAHDGSEHTGTVRSIEPTGILKLTLDDGSVASLPALATSLLELHDAERPG